jgi:pimeloyl-ACP methyl ester carboxylesterase
LCGNSESEKTLVYLVGGTGFSVAWFKHIQLMEHEYRILTLEYPVGIEQMEKLADHIMSLIKELGIQKPVLIGASLGGMLAQVIARRYAGSIFGICLYSTCSLSETSINGLKKQYRSYGILLPVMKVIPYNWIRKLLINVSRKKIGAQNGTDEEKAWLDEFFTWVYQSYTKELDIHMTTLMADVPNLTPVTQQEYAAFDEKSLLILPLNDEAFPKEAQQDLMDMMPRANVIRLNGGHVATLYKVEEYVNATKQFLKNDSE